MGQTEKTGGVGARIQVTKDGPYVVTGGVPLAKQFIVPDAKGQSASWRQGQGPDAFPPQDTYALCRCGKSAKKPFCDGTHAKVGFDGTEKAKLAFSPGDAQKFPGPKDTLVDEGQGYCAFARFCDPNGRVWNNVKGASTPAQQAAFEAQVGRCPAGRLLAIKNQTGQPVEPELPPQIGVIEDVGFSGALWVQGGVQISGENGDYQVRNRVTLCRCGRSGNKPLCDGSHAADPKFNDAS
jgi:CDGSH-type Zn-finger protein